MADFQKLFKFMVHNKIVISQHSSGATQHEMGSTGMLSVEMTAVKSSSLNYNSL
jgi:phage antirepressor YoqD-like protein